MNYVCIIVNYIGAKRNKVEKKGDIRRRKEKKGRKKEKKGEIRG